MWNEYASSRWFFANHMDNIQTINPPGDHLRWFVLLGHSTMSQCYHIFVAQKDCHIPVCGMPNFLSVKKKNDNNEFKCYHFIWIHIIDWNLPHLEHSICTWNVWWQSFRWWNSIVLCTLCRMCHSQFLVWVHSLRTVHPFLRLVELYHS